ncbi:RDD family protein [Aerococcus kribbianus]|uniref:RDD family protein n=1 Tax=Aerococcus kribbianus TaxID=2999064 RepID=A0A9X3FRB7_9LACT|nr:MULTISPECIES: RDD family protein [unclassified Aerococcus]MCZ0716927.1 RDD family protein [Aerococcus sp. YH-aer221]MCZ0725215.1 RDD family protein [Aerococcus sp. YH-aer222]
MDTKTTSQNHDNSNKDLPELNDKAYLGVLESEQDRQRYQRKKKSRRLSGHELWSKNRKNVRNNVVDGFSKYLYAGFWVRTVAFLIDMIMVWALQALLLGGANYFSPEPIASLSLPLNYVIKQAILIIYFTLTTYLLNGQSFGKLLLDIQVVHDKQERLSLGTCFIREGLGKLILSTIPILAITVIFSRKRENFIDYFTDTNVISLKQFRFLYEEIGLNQ